MKRLYIHILLIVLFSILFTTFITQIPNPIFTNIGSKDSWINFFGAITGGFLTLYGVWWTIKEQKNDLKKQQNQFEIQRLEDLAIQYKPLIKISDYDENIITDINHNKHTLSFSIKNIGRGEANKLKIKFNDDIEILDYNTDSKNTYYINTFPSDEMHLIKIEFYKKLNDKEATEEDRTIEFYIYYEDLYSIYEFTTIGQIHIHPKTWPHTIKSIDGEIESRKKELSNL